MIGHSNTRIEGEPIFWPDSSLDRVEFDYDDLHIILEDETQRRTLIRCSGFIGIQMIGFWDEVIIERAEIHSEHAFIAECERRVKNQLPSGAPARVESGNRLLEIVFIDDCRLWVCANRFQGKAVDEKRTN